MTSRRWDLYKERGRLIVNFQNLEKSRFLLVKCFRKRAISPECEVDERLILIDLLKVMKTNGFIEKKEGVRKLACFGRANLALKTLRR